MTRQADKPLYPDQHRRRVQPDHLRHAPCRLPRRILCRLRQRWLHGERWLCSQRRLRSQRWLRGGCVSGRPDPRRLRAGLCACLWSSHIVNAPRHSFASRAARSGCRCRVDRRDGGGGGIALHPAAVPRRRQASWQRRHRRGLWAVWRRRAANQRDRCLWRAAHTAAAGGLGCSGGGCSGGGGWCRQRRGGLCGDGDAGPADGAVGPDGSEAGTDILFSKLV